MHNCEEVEKIKNQYITSKIFQKESLESFSMNLAQNFLLYEDLEMEDKMLSLLQSVTVQEINDYIQKYFSLDHIYNLVLPNDQEKKKNTQCFILLLLVSKQLWDIIVLLHNTLINIP